MQKPLSIILLLALVGDSAAEVDRCATADVDLAWRAQELPLEFNGDTGWFPSGFVAQLRLSGRVVGHTAVDAGMRTTACWDNAMQAQVTGRAGSGWLDVGYGAEVKLQGRIHTSILGQAIDWEGTIPLASFPTDLVLAGYTAFDPTLDGTQGSVSDSTSPITLLSTDVLGSIINIIGISGGLRITVSPIMSTTYQTRGATISGVTVDSPTDVVPVPQTNLGGSLDLDIAADGLVRYEPTLKFEARFDVKILGFRVVDWILADVSMNLPAIERPVQLTGDAAHFALAKVDGIGNGARMDFAFGATQELSLRNHGEAPLVVEVVNPPAGVSAGRLEIQPSGQAALRVTADDTAFANGPVMLVLATNDPEMKQITIQLGKDVGGTDPGDIDEDVPSEGGCSTTGGSGVGGLLLIALVLRRRRR